MRAILFAGALLWVPGLALAQSFGSGDIGSFLNLGKEIIESQQPQRQQPQTAPSQTPQSATSVSPDTAAPPSTPSPSGPAHNSVEVREVQQRLSDLGYSPGPIDGMMGSKTAAAIRRFEQDTGLASTGRIDGDLLTALRNTEASASVSSQAAAQPSFDCSRAGTAVEHTICNSSALAELDRNLADLYAQTLAQSSAPEEIKHRQRDWLQERDSCGASEACLMDAMHTRIDDLGGHSPAQPVDAETAGPQSRELAAPDIEPAEATTRDDGIRVHSSGRLIMPYPVLNPNSPEGRESAALAQFLWHATAGEHLDVLVPADNPSLMAQAAKDYLPLSEIRPFFCTRNEMMRDASDCMSHSDALYHYSLGGGNVDNSQQNSFIWWRGATEFDRRRSMTEFLESGLRERIATSAPDSPVQLIYAVEIVLESYDFDAGNFPIEGDRNVGVSGSNSDAFNLADVVRPLSVPPEEAEPLLQMLKDRGDGRPELTLGVKVNLTPDQPHAGRPRWSAEVISAEYYLDADASQPISQVIGTSEEAVSAPDTDAAPQPAAAAPGSVLREFDLRREDGRIVLQPWGYKEPGPGDREAIQYIIASAARDILDSVEVDNPQHVQSFGLAMLYPLLNEENRIKYFGCSSFETCDDKNFAGLEDFGGETEFETRRNRTSFENEVPEKLLAEAPVLPIPLRQYFDAKLNEYDFEREGFGLQISQEKRLRVGPRSWFTFQPVFELIPDFLPMAPDTAEQLVSAPASDPILRLDYDVVTVLLPDQLAGDVLAVIQPVAMVLATGENRDRIHYQKSYATNDQDEAAADAARRLLGRELTNLAAPKQPTDYPVLGVAPGMTVEAALNMLSQSFADEEIDVTDGLLRAERGACRYEPLDSPDLEQELGAVCFLAMVVKGRISRVVSRRVERTGVASRLVDEQKELFGTPDSRSEEGAPEGSMARGFFGWGTKLDQDRDILGRAGVEMAPHEAELDATYLTPQLGVVTLRSDAVSTSGNEGVKPEAAPETETSTPVVNAGEFAVADIHLGMTLADAINRLRGVGEIIYRATLEPEEPELVQDRYTFLLIDNGETFALHTGTGEGAPVIGIARKIPVGENVPLSAIRDAFVETYGAPVIEEERGSRMIWRWERPDNESAAGISCVGHFIDPTGSGAPERLADVEKDTDAIIATLDSTSVERHSDEGFFRYYLKDRAPRVGLEREDELGRCDPFLNVRVIPSQTHSNQVQVHLVDPQAFAAELESNVSKNQPAEFESKL